MAGAGTGKTRALVERCLHCLLEDRPRVSLDQILVVTFTEAAAAEMRQRIRARLEQEATSKPGDAHWQEQLALFETAHIGTLHSFCLKLVRQQFYELELDPQLSVIPEEESYLLAQETLDRLLNECYEGKRKDASVLAELIGSNGRGSDSGVRNLVLRLHHYAQSLPAPSAWLDKQLKIFEQPKPTLWRRWFVEAVNGWGKRWGPIFEKQARSANAVASGCLEGLSQFVDGSGEAIAGLLQTVEEAENGCPKKQNGAWIKPLKTALDEAGFLKSLASSGNGADPLQEDWDWVRGWMAALLGLTRDFGKQFAEAKKELGGVDFQDLEQHALRLLWDYEEGRPTATAEHWRQQLRFVFVDEYQDINAAQDQILTALSRDGTDANRFLVGDVKQSIYRFRLANPRIFQTYAATWRTGHCHTIPLVENFRSREGILNFVNFVFESTMCAELGGIAYNEEARLRFGAPESRAVFREQEEVAPAVEIHLRIKGAESNSEGESEPTEGQAEMEGLEEAAKEARLIGTRLQQLRASQHPVWDEEGKSFRPVDWGDMAVLLRAPSGKSESYAREFARLGIPLHVERGGFFSSSEVNDLLSLLRLLDNPLQDVPAIAVLRSPLVALSLNELATIRLVTLKAPFWTALNRFCEHGAPAPERPNCPVDPSAASKETLSGKVSRFLEQYARWRRLARQTSLSRCLETVLAETQYESWVQLQSRGARRRANVDRLLSLARGFDKLQRQGLFRFLKYIEAQQEAETEPEVSAECEDNAVRLLSVHQSKGLEFPVVVAGDLGKRFNLSDTRAEIILDEEYGLCPLVMAPKVRKRYPSLAHWLAARRQKRELLGEELRLLYVAMSRARDLLLLTASISRKSYETKWAATAEMADPAGATSCADWLAMALGKEAPATAEPGLSVIQGIPQPGGGCRVRWQFHADAAAGTEPSPVTHVKPAEGGEKPGRRWEEIRERLEWRYGFLPATREPAKTTVTALRRRALIDQAASAAAQVEQPTGRSFGYRGARGAKEGTDAGTAHHMYLQWVDLKKTGRFGQLKEELSRLQAEQLLSEEQAGLIDLEGIAAFWNSDLGSRIRAQAGFVQRELPFTFRLSPEDVLEVAGDRAKSGLAREANSPATALAAQEFVVVQGAADLVVILPQEIWLVDFKTDKTEPEATATKYAAQMKLYSRALRVIYKRPVTQCWLWLLASRQGVAVQC